MPSIDDLCNKFFTVLQQWNSIREDTIQQIHNTIEKLNFHHRNVNVSRIGGSTISIVGSAMAIGGVIMAPATAGLSLGLSFGGTALAVAGGVTTAGASIADVLIQKSNVQDAQQQLIRDYEQLYVISALAIAIQSKVGDDLERQQHQDISTAELLAGLGLALTQGVFRASSLGIKVAELFATTFAAIKAGGAVPARVAFSESLGKLVGGTIGGLLGRTVGKSLAPEAARAGSIVVKGLAKAGVALNLITIPFDIYEIVRSSSSLANGSETDAVKELSQIVEQLEEEKEAIARIQEEHEQVINEPPQE